MLCVPCTVCCLCPADHSQHPRFTYLVRRSVQCSAAVRVLCVSCVPLRRRRHGSEAEKLA